MAVIVVRASAVMNMVAMVINTRRKRRRANGAQLTNTGTEAAAGRW